MKETKVLVLPYLMTSSTGQGYNKCYFEIHPTRSIMNTTKNKNLLSNKLSIATNTTRPEFIKNKLIKEKIKIEPKVRPLQKLRPSQNKHTKSSQKKEVYYKLTGNLNINQLIDNTKKSEIKYKDSIYYQSQFNTIDHSSNYRSVDFINENFIFNDLNNPYNSDGENSLNLQSQKKFCTISNDIARSLHFSRKNSCEQISNKNNISLSNLQLPEQVYYNKIKGPDFNKQLEREGNKSKRSILKEKYDPNLANLEHNITKKHLKSSI